MTDVQREKCHMIIHSASISAGAVGAGLAQLPGTDAAVIIPIQITMVLALGKIFNKHVTDSIARGVVLSTAATFGGRLLSQFLVGWIPFVGNAVNATTAAGITEAMGWSVADKFDRGEIS